MRAEAAVVPILHLEQNMRRFIFALLLVAVLLSLFAGVAFATCPEYEDPLPPGAAHASQIGADHIHCVQVSSHAWDNGNFTACP